MNRVGAGVEGFRNGVGAGINDVGVIAKTAHQGVATGAAIEDVVGAIADDHVVEGIAGAVDGAGAGEAEVLHIGNRCQGEGHRGLNRVCAGVERFRNGVGGGINAVGVVAVAAHKRVNPSSPIEAVIAGATAEAVVACAADESIGIVAAVDGSGCARVDHGVAVRSGG